MLYGDSHAAAIAPAVSAILRERGERGVQATFLGCAPALGLERVDSNYNCEEFNHRVTRYLSDHPSIRHVIVAARWTILSEQKEFDNGEGGHESAERPVFHVASSSGLPQGGTPMDASMAAIRALRQAGYMVTVVYPIPEVGWDVPKAMRIERPANDEALSTSYEIYKARVAAAVRSLDALPQEVRRVYPDRALCDAASGRCHALQGGQPLYYDDDHLSPKGAALALGSLR
jgi:hypothetical protein